MVDREKMRDTSITGKLADDPRQRQGRDGSSFVTMRVIENQRAFDRNQQQWVDGDAVGYDVAIGNERLAKHSLNNLSKGDRVTVRGDVQVSPYVHKETGEPGLNRRMNARDVQVSMFDDRFEEGVGQQADPRLVAEVEADRRAANHEQFLEEAHEHQLATDPEYRAHHEHQLATDPEYRALHAQSDTDGVRAPLTERAPLDGPGTAPPPGPPQQTASVEFGQPTAAQQREVAARQQRVEQSWAAAAQQQQQMQQPQAGFGGPSL